jgi:deoxyribonuclease V
MQVEKKLLKKLREEQLRLKVKIMLQNGFSTVNKICGIDVSFKTQRARTVAVGAAAIFCYKTKKLIEVISEKTHIDFPYIPTYLVYRELPVIERLVHKYRKSTDTIFMIDGHGILHPFGIGCASHIGVIFDIPTIGVAKKLLCGNIKKIPSEIGMYSEVKLDGQTVGYALKTTHRNMIYISPGHKICLKTALQVVLQFTKYKIPEPIRLAHLYSRECIKTVS